jgi:hypothetical protein
VAGRNREFVYHCLTRDVISIAVSRADVDFGANGLRVKRYI